MAEATLEKKSGLWIGLFVIVMSIIYVLVTLGKTDWVRWIAIIWGFFLAGLLFSEAGIIEYFRKKEYKKLGFGDFVVWMTVASAVIVLMNTFLLIQVVRENAPLWLVSFSQTTGLIAGSIAGILGIAHILLPRFK
jgi:hypothetical protein